MNFGLGKPKIISHGGHGGRFGIRAGTLRLGALVRADRGPEIRDFLTQRHEDSKDMDVGPRAGTLRLGGLVRGGSGTDEPKTISHKGTEARRENGIHPGLCGFVA